MILKLLSLLIIAPSLANVSPIENKASSLISSREDLKVAISAAKDGDVILVDDIDFTSGVTGLYNVYERIEIKKSVTIKGKDSGSTFKRGSFDIFGGKTYADLLNVKFENINFSFYENNKNLTSEESKEEIRQRKNQRKQTFQTTKTDYNTLIKNMDILRRNKQSKILDNKISILYNKINSLNKSSRRPKSFSKYSVKENLLNFQKENLNDSLFNNENKQNKTPFRIYYKEFPKKSIEQPFKLYKNNLNSNDYNSVNLKTNINNYKNTITYPDYLSFDHIDNWINNEKRMQNSNFYTDKRCEISNLVSFTRNNDNNNDKKKFLHFNSYEGIKRNNNDYYSGDYFRSELNRFTSLLNRNNNNKRRSNNNLFFSTVYSRKYN